jgi:cytochrome c oxidase subunit 2
MPPIVRSLRPASILAAAVAVATLVAFPSAALAGNGGFAPVAPESPNADSIHTTYLFISIFCFAIFLLVEGLLVVFLIRFRRKRRPRFADGAQIHGATKLEFAWTAGPVLILAVIAGFVFFKLPGIDTVPEATAGSTNLVVDVTGTQFTWHFRYPNGVVQYDTMRAPVGRTVELHITAPDWDVIHSWWIPALGGKMDAIPGTLNKTWFKARRTGVFQGQCAELCGLFHAKMLASVDVMPADEFDTWLAKQRQQQSSGTGSLGSEMWTASCAKCHGPAGEGDYGPKIAGSTLLSDPQSVEKLLRNGFGKMPPVGREWDDTEMNAITTYLKDNIGG